MLGAAAFGFLRCMAVRITKARGALSFALLVGLGWVPEPAAQTAAAHAVLREVEAMGVRCGCAVLDERGDPLLLYRSGEAFGPASNQKVLTAVAALQRLGEDHEFVTRFDLVRGRLVVTPSGDPNFESGTAHEPRVMFAAVAARLARRGIRAVRSIEIAAAGFAGPARPDGWPQDQLHKTYCPPTGGLVVDRGAFLVVARRDGGVVRLDVRAPRGIPVVDKSRAGSGRNTLGVREQAGRLIVGGRLTQDEVRAAGAQDDGLAVAQSMLQAALADAGIAVDAELPDASLPADLAVAVQRSTLVEALTPMLAESSNFHAEMVLRAMGVAADGDGSFAGGLRAARASLSGLGLKGLDGCVFADGSGLSRANRATPRLLATALSQAARADYASAFRAALPRPGSPGSLRARFRGSPVAEDVAAKTGWIRGVSSLSGYVGGRAFSILMNYAPSRGGLNRNLKRLQERLVEAFAGITP